VPVTVPGRTPQDSDSAISDASATVERGARSPGEAPAGPRASEHRKGPRQVRAGDMLGRYELGEELGEGGMATVFRARDRELRRDVALKVLFPHLARRPEIVHRFHREARAAAGLEHPNILRVYDVGGGEADDPPYIVMELVRGSTLAQQIEQRGAMLAEVAACIGALLGDALAAAHAAGIIHRDVKPANVLIAPGGRLLLADFGVARVETEDSLVTRTGALLGTPAYMSPEQAGGELATARSDLYSLGATLYQLATGALPYSGGPAKVMSMIAAGNLVAPVRRRPACGPDLSRLIERMMAVDPAARPASAIAIAGELRACAAAGGLGDAGEELAAYFADPDGFLRRRTPAVVGALVAAARAAAGEARLPRAMALADRANTLAPDDPSVAALVASVTAGGHTARRNRWLAIAGAAAVLAGGVVVLGWQLAGAPAGERRDGEAVILPGSGDGAASAASAIAAADVAPVPAHGLDAGVTASGPGRGDGAIAGGIERATPSPSSVAPIPRDDSRAAASDDSRAAASDDRALPADRRASPADGRASPADGRALPADRRASPADGRAPATDRHAPAPVAAAAAGPPRPSTGDPARTVEHNGERAAANPVVDAAAHDAGAPAVSSPPTLDAAAEPARALGHVIVRNDVWCRISIDGVDRGNRRNEPLEVTAGRHVVRCVNPAGEWTQEVDVAPGATRTLAGTLLREVEVRLAVDATIDGVRHARGTVVKLKPGNVEVVVGSKKQFITFRSNCTLSDVPELGCYL
jgi:Protein kinase domain